MGFGTIIKDWSVDVNDSPVDLTGKYMIVIGGTNGLGREIALAAVEKGANVTVVGRKLVDADKSIDKLSFVQADLSTMKTAKDIGETICATDIA
jgi:NAD(P)-dependent dehydrogenase (short-subunit alcohol dehydrogenase family)